PGQLRDVDTIVAERGFQDGQVDGLAAGVQHDVVGHGCAPRGSDVRTGPWSPATSVQRLPQRSNYRTGGLSTDSDFGPVRPGAARWLAACGIGHGTPDTAAQNDDSRPKAAVCMRVPGNGAFPTRLLRVATLELVDATAGIHDLVLAGVERMRGRGHFDLDQRIFLAVFPLDRLLGGGG